LFVVSSFFAFIKAKKTCFLQIFVVRFCSGVDSEVQEQDREHRQDFAVVAQVGAELYPIWKSCLLDFKKFKSAVIQDCVQTTG